MIRGGVVENVAEWDGESEWNPGDDYDVIDCAPQVSPGWLHDDDGFRAPPEPVVENPA
jgi:hypothetical protein